MCRRRCNNSNAAHKRAFRGLTLLGAGSSSGSSTLPSARDASLCSIPQAYFSHTGVLKPS